MPSAPTTSIDLTSPDVVADPYPFFAAERARHPVAWHEGTRTWLAFDHASVSAVQRDRRMQRLWRDREMEGRPADHLAPFNLLHRNQMMENEPPEHTRLRRPVASAFARGHVERLRPRVRELASQLLDEVEGEDFDLIGAYAEPLPVLVIAELLGVPASYAPDLRRWSQAIVRMYEPAPGAEVVDAAVRAATDFAGLVRELVAERRARPQEDLITDLATGSAGGGDLSDDEVVAAVVLLLNAGHEASVNVFGNGATAMLQRGLVPAQDVALTVEECLRFDSALQLFERTATAPVEVGGVTVQPGERIAVLLGSANRDERVFSDPDRYDIFRDKDEVGQLLSFGGGRHFCLGANLARLEAQIALRELVRRVRSVDVAHADCVRVHSINVRGFASVPVRMELR